jgi:methionine--tRNA ligase beta chain
MCIIMTMSEKINYEDFKKVEIRVGEIISVEQIEGSEKLLKLKVDFGPVKSDDLEAGHEERQILSGIKNYYEDEQVLVGKKVPFVTNLETRKMMGLESQGMILAVNDEDTFSLLEADKNIKNGTHVS